MLYKPGNIYFGTNDPDDPSVFYELAYFPDMQLSCSQYPNTTPRERFIQLSTTLPKQGTRVLGLRETYAVPIERNLLHRMFSSILPILDVSKPNFQQSPMSASPRRRSTNIPIAKIKNRLTEESPIKGVPSNCSILQYSVEKDLIELQEEEPSKDNLNIPRVVSRSSLNNIASGSFQSGNFSLVSAPTPSVVINSNITKPASPQSRLTTMKSVISNTVLNTISSVKTSSLGQKLGLSSSPSNEHVPQECSSMSTLSGTNNLNIQRSMSKATLTGALLDNSGNLLVFTNFYERNLVLRIPQGTGSLLSFGFCDQFLPGNPATHKKLVFKLKMVTFPVINYSNCCLFVSEMILNFNHATLTTFLLAETTNICYSFPSIIPTDKDPADSKMDCLYKQDVKSWNKAMSPENTEILHRYYFFKIDPQAPDFTAIHDLQSATAFVQKYVMERQASDSLIGCAALSIQGLPQIYVPDLSFIKNTEPEVKPTEPQSIMFGFSSLKRDKDVGAVEVNNETKDQVSGDDCESSISTVNSLSTQSYTEFETLRSAGILLPTNIPTKALTGIEALQACSKSLLTILTHQRSYFIGVFPMRPFTLHHADPRKIMNSCNKKSLLTINILIENADTASKESVGHTLKSLPPISNSVKPNINTYLILTFPKDEVLGAIINAAYRDHNIAGVYVYNQHSEHVTQTLERTFSTFSILNPSAKRKSLSNLQSILPEYCALSSGPVSKHIASSSASSDCPSIKVFNESENENENNDSNDDVDADDVTNVVLSQFLHQDLQDHGLSPTVSGETRHLLDLHLERLVENIYSLVYAKIYNSVISALNCNILLNLTGCSCVGKTELVHSFLGAEGGSYVQESSYTSLERVYTYLNGNFSHPFAIDYEDLLRELAKYRLKCVRDGCIFSLYEGALSVYNPSILDKAERNLVVHLHANQATVHYRKFKSSVRTDGNKLFINQIWPCYRWYRDTVLSAATKYLRILNHDTTQHKPEETYSYIMYLLGRMIESCNHQFSKGALI